MRALSITPESLAPLPAAEEESCADLHVHAVVMPQCENLLEQIHGMHRDGERQISRLPSGTKCNLQLLSE